MQNSTKGMEHYHEYTKRPCNFTKFYQHTLEGPLPFLRGTLQKLRHPYG